MFVENLFIYLFWLPMVLFFIILLYIFSEQDIQWLKNYLMMYVALKIQVPGIKKET